MTNQQPKITTLHPLVFPDKRRVMLELAVDHLPTTFSNVTLTMPDLAAPRPAPPPEANTPSPYPNIELAILNSHRQEVASLFIVEHKETYISLTLHLRAPDINEQYIARGELTYQDKVLDVVEVGFTLNQDN